MWILFGFNLHEIFILCVEADTIKLYSCYENKLLTRPCRLFVIVSKVLIKIRII